MSRWAMYLTSFGITAQPVESAVLLNNLALSLSTLNSNPEVRCGSASSTWSLLPATPVIWRVSACFFFSAACFYHHQLSQ